MKSWLMTLPVLMGMSLTMDACSHDGPLQTEDTASGPEHRPNPDPVPGPAPSKGNVLVAYFSCTGTTEAVAEEVADITSGFLYRIDAETPYTSADLDYNTDCRANREQNDPAARPAIKGMVENLADYDVVFIGYPIWWGAAPKVICTFLEKHNLDGKIIVPFCTSHTSGLGASDTALHVLAPKAEWQSGKRFGANEKRAAIEECLRKLDIGYVDLMLLHHPGIDDVKAYKAMEKYVAEGKIRSVGVSCYYVDEIDRFLRQVNVKPVLVQNEVHPYYQDTEVVKHLHELGIVVEAWYPLGGRGHQIELLSDPVLSRIAANHNKSVAQVILRWNLQRGVVVIPGSCNPDHMKENISVFDFELSDEEMAEIASVNRNEKHD